MLERLLETIDITIIAALVTVVVTVISPALVALINHRASYRVASLEMFFHAKIDAYRDVLHITSSFPQHPTSKDFHELIQVINYALVFSSEDTQSALSYLATILANNPIMLGDLNKLAPANKAVILAIQNEIQQYEYAAPKRKRKRGKR